jgi:hypothetical protein
MKHFHPFYVIGTIGMIVSGIFHLVLTLGLSLPAVHTTFYVLYSTFFAFLLLGIRFSLQPQKIKNQN